MVRFILLAIFFFPALSNAQELSLVSATRQTVNQGAGGMSVTNYRVTLKKEKDFFWSIDSVVSISTGKKIAYHLVHSTDPAATSPDFRRIVEFCHTDRGFYILTFSNAKKRGTGRPGAPQQVQADTADVDGGVVVWYTSGKGKKKIVLETYEQLETVNAP